MVIVRFKGGLGNQLFQYGIYKQMQSMDKDVKADISDYEEIEESRHFLLQEIGIELDYATAEEIEKYRGKRNSIPDIVRRRFGMRRGYFGENEAVVDTSFTSKDDIYLDGFWQNRVYFKDVEEEMLQELRSKLCIVPDSPNIVIKEKIEKCNAVSIHIRRGDYIKEKSIYNNLCESKYYEKAIRFIKNKIANPIFYIFSDDIEWAKERFMGTEFIVTEDYPGKQEQEDLLLMSTCKHNIIANSSYSWWAAMLNKNFEKIVIAPERWFTIQKETRLVCENWISL